jgi:putative hydrolase of HD superfamily
MVLVHDLVEIDAGDAFCYDADAQRKRPQREQRAADRLFPLLPEDQARSLRELWEEFEARRTPEARFAAALDRLQPLLHNFHTRGAAWQEHGVTCPEVLARNRGMKDGAPSLWEAAEAMIRDAVDKGYLAP